MGAVVLTGLMVAGCGGGEKNARDQVDAYITRANAVQRSFTKDFDRANDAYVAFSRSELGGDEAVAQLAAAGEEIRSARAEVAELDPPAAAQTLHRRLLQVFDLNLDFAEQTRRLAAYQQGSAEALAPLDRVDAGLRRDLRRADGPGQQVRALQRFQRGLTRAVRALRALDVPRVLVPPHGDQVRRLVRTRGLAARLERALRGQQARKVAELVREFRANASDRSARRALAKRALKQYERRYRRLNDAYAALSRENARLDQTL